MGNVRIGRKQDGADVRVAGAVFFHPLGAQDEGRRRNRLGAHGGRSDDGRLTQGRRRPARPRVQDVSKAPPFMLEVLLGRTAGRRRLISESQPRHGRPPLDGAGDVDRPTFRPGCGADRPDAAAASAKQRGVDSAGRHAVRNPIQCVPLSNGPEIDFHSRAGRPHRPRPGVQLNMRHSNAQQRFGDLVLGRRTAGASLEPPYGDQGSGGHVERSTRFRPESTALRQKIE